VIFVAKKSADEYSPDALAKLAIQAINESATSTKAYALGAHAEHTWGIPIPSLAFQWVIGGCNVFPCQRYLSVSGEPKSFKSTLMIELLTWHVLANGLGYAIDNESKSSASMLEAMTWWRLTPEQQGMLIFKETASVEEWQKVTTAAIDLAKKVGYREKGKRIPFFVSIDSLTGKASESEQEEVAKEGMAAARGFPVRASQITRYIETMQLLGATCSVGYVRHLKQAIDAQASHGPPQKRETGGSAANFKASLSLRITKLGGTEYATHAGMPHPSVPSLGHPLIIESNMSCLGPDKRKLQVDLLWQYVDPTGGEGPRRQIMKYDWDGALGRLLWSYKYDPKFCQNQGIYAYDKERLDKLLYFVQEGSKYIKCEELGLSGATHTEFGHAIEANPEVRAKVSTLLDIVQYKSVQDVDLDEQGLIGSG
jgi:hypothetical protein